MPTVSVCIPVYNRERYIATTLHSVLEQDFEDFEIIISDNRSSDNTLDVIRQFSDSRIHLIHSDEHTPMYANFNRCLRAIRGKYIKFLLSDDYFVSRSALGRFVSILDNQQEVGIVSCLSVYVDEMGRYLGEGHGSQIEKRTNKFIRRYLERNKNPGHITNDFVSDEFINLFRSEGLVDQDVQLNGKKLINIIYRSGTDRWCQSPTHAFFRADFISTVGLFNEEVSSGWGVETEYWMRLLAFRNFYKICCPLVAFRLHGESATSNIYRRHLQFVDLERNYALILSHCGKEISKMSKVLNRLSLEFYTIKHFLQSIVKGQKKPAWQVIRAFKAREIPAALCFPAMVFLKKWGNDLF